MKPEEELMRFHVSKVSSEKQLKEKLALFFPGLQFSRELIPKERETDTLKTKKIDGLGKFYFYSRKGKMQFHEFILDKLCRELKKRKIAYTRPNKKRGADLIIGNKKIELETRSNPAKQPQNRNKLLQRIRNDPKNQIIICMNQRDKRAYMQSQARDILISNNQILTYLEFLERMETILKK